MRTFKVVFIFVAITLLVGAVVPLRAQSKGPNLVGLRPDAPAYAKHGPFWVGYKPLVIGEGTANRIDAGLWYPALNPNGSKEAITYQINFKFKTFAPSAEVLGHALLNASVDSSKGPYPLIVFSHGTSSNAPFYSTILEHFASYGFIVIAPEHKDGQDSNGWALAEIDRPRDDKQVIDYAEKMTATGGAMAGLIDMKHVAAAGHSQGGSTALTMAGGQFDLDALAVRCAKLSKDDPIYPVTCGGLIGFESEMAKRAGLSSVPKGLWPSLGDPRVTAIVTMAGDSYMFDKAGHSKITIPVMALGGTIDTATPYEWGVKPTYEQVSSSQKALVTFENADHPIFMELCKNLPFASKLDSGFYQWMCFQPVWDRERAMDLVDHFATAFLLDQLKGDKDAHKALLPDAAKFAGVEYKTTMK